MGSRPSRRLRHESPPRLPSHRLRPKVNYRKPPKTESEASVEFIIRPLGGERLGHRLDVRTPNRSRASEINSSADYFAHEYTLLADLRL
jgi:hypothetical protein